MVINPIVGVYIPIIRIPIKGGMTIPNKKRLLTMAHIITYNLIYPVKWMIYLSKISVVHNLSQKSWEALDNFLGKVDGSPSRRRVWRSVFWFCDLGKNVKLPKQEKNTFFLAKKRHEKTSVFETCVENFLWFFEANLPLVFLNYFWRNFIGIQFSVCDHGNLRAPPLINPTPPPPRNKVTIKGLLTTIIP